MTGFLARRGLRLGVAGHLLAGLLIGGAWALLACAAAHLLIP